MYLLGTREFAGGVIFYLLEICTTGGQSDRVMKHIFAMCKL